MNRSNFHLSKLVLTGLGKAEAAVDFKSGLNVIAGASNTGKTFIFHAIDFMLGDSEPLQEIPESRGYTHAQLEFVSHLAVTYTMSRALAGGNAQLFKVPIGQITGTTPSTQLGAKAIKGNTETISAFLLGLTGLNGKEVRRNELGQKSVLSFRDIAWLTLVDEERIITKSSPLLSGQYTEVTKEKAIFGLFLTGTDDAAIIAQEKPKDRKTRLQTELNLLEELFEEREQQLKKVGVEVSGLPEQRRKLELAIEKASTVVATRQNEIDTLAEQRDNAWRDIQKIESRRLFLGEQLKRLKLLHMHYASDSARLEATLEAGSAFEHLPSGQCPVCGHLPSDTESKKIDIRLTEFQQSCQAEMAKIQALSKDLDASLIGMEAEDRKLVGDLDRLKEVLADMNHKIDDLLRHQLNDADAKLSDLLRVQSKLIEAATTQSEIVGLRSRYASIEQALEVKIPKLKLATKVETRTAARFCDVIATTLKAWKYPNLGTISFDTNRFDLVIGDQNRGSMGKGYRALTHAAFIISLMRYCRLENLPHPGFVIVDTPLNPFRGPDDPTSDFVNQEVQNAFYEDLTADRSGDQFIILENTEPPATLTQNMNYIHFSGTRGKSRYGFFPLASSE